MRLIRRLWHQLQLHQMALSYDGHYRCSCGERL